MQVFVKGITGKTSTYYPIQPTMKVEDFKKLVYDKTGVEVGDQRLIYCAKQMENGRTLRQYNVRNEATLHLVVRLKGGSDKVIPEHQRMFNAFCTPGTDIGWAKSTKDDDPILYDTTDTVRFQIKPCDHVVSRIALRRAAKLTRQHKQTVISCTGDSDCTSQLDFAQILPYMLYTRAEMKTEENEFAKAAVERDPEMGLCPWPGCQSFCVFNDTQRLCVNCPACRNPDYCWRCKKKWRSPSPSSGKCGNECVDWVAHKTDIVMNAPTKTIPQVDGPTKDLRLCPKCELPIMHKRACKHMTCSPKKGGCGYEFCFGCLIKWEGGHLGVTCKPARTQKPKLM